MSMVFHWKGLYYCTNPDESYWQHTGVFHSVSSYKISVTCKTGKMVTCSGFWYWRVFLWINEIRIFTLLVYLACLLAHSPIAPSTSHHAPEGTLHYKIILLTIKEEESQRNWKWHLLKLTVTLFFWTKHLFVSSYPVGPMPWIPLSFKRNPAIKRSSLLCWTRNILQSTNKLIILSSVGLPLHCIFLKLFTHFSSSSELLSK